MLQAAFERPYQLGRAMRSTHAHVAADTLFHIGAFVILDAQGLASPGADLAGHRWGGIAIPQRFPDDPDAHRNVAFNNTGGPSHAGVVRFETDRVFLAEVVGGGTPGAGNLLYVVDDEQLTFNAAGVTNAIVAGRALYQETVDLPRGLDRTKTWWYVDPVAAAAQGVP
ncbi:MAG: hypothetical protein AAGC60_00340 [Acidobacteriota bacterium]